MPTETNIGPCDCCGGGNCPCSLYAVCYWTWNGSAWEPFATPNPCNGVDELDRPRAPCCECPGPPDYDGTYVGQTGESACAPVAGSDMCECYECEAEWDSFLEQWVVVSPCTGPEGQDDSSYTCTCLVPDEPGTTHGQSSGTIPCGCPS